MPMDRKRESLMREVSFDVEGFPPLKNQATSMFAARHGHASSVVLLLVAARHAISGRPFQAFTTPVGLEVVVRAPDGAVRGDATNYLGGIGDTLQEKGHLTIPLDHLGDLVAIALFLDDKQIQEIHYRQEKSTTNSYQVRIWLLADGSNDISAGVD